MDDGRNIEYRRYVLESTDGEPPEEIGASPSQPSDLQSVSYSIETDITNIVDEVSDAVVGVVNIQQAGFLGMPGEGTGSVNWTCCPKSSIDVGAMDLSA